jgi:5-formyltetrahydrofolate cyclo-ligase
MGQCKRVAHGGKISGMNEFKLAKAQLRAEILLARKTNIALDQEKQQLAQNIISIVNRLNPTRVAIYSSYPSEPDTQLAIVQLLASNTTVLEPVTLPDGLLSWHEVGSDEQTVLEPTDLLFVPALAADLQGNRLGRGKGYFDRELAKNSINQVYAVVFESEVLSHVPVETHDRKVSGVVTEVAIRDLN